MLLLKINFPNSNVLNLKKVNFNGCSTIPLRKSPKPGLINAHFKGFEVLYLYLSLVRYPPLNFITSTETETTLHIFTAFYFNCNHYINTHFKGFLVLSLSLYYDPTIKFHNINRNRKRYIFHSFLFYL